MYKITYAVPRERTILPVSRLGCSRKVAQPLLLIKLQDLGRGPDFNLDTTKFELMTTIQMLIVFNILICYTKFYQERLCRITLSPA